MKLIKIKAHDDLYQQFSKRHVWVNVNGIQGLYVKESSNNNHRFIAVYMKVDGFSDLPVEVFFWRPIEHAEEKRSRERAEEALDVWAKKLKGLRL